MVLVAAAALAHPAAVAAQVPPAEAYQLHCSGCHGPDGRGDGRMIPSLRTLAPLLEAPGGRAYMGRVPGVAQASLPSAELARLLNWMLGTLSGATGFAPFEADEVEALRRTPLRDPVAARPRIDPPSGRRPGVDRSLAR